MDERIRRVVEQITDDSSLTDELGDPEATRLIEWGAAVARQLALLTVEMDSYQADQYLDQHLQALRTAIRRINRLVGKLPALAPDELAEGLPRIFEAAAQVPVVRCAPPQEFQRAAQEMYMLAPGQALNYILSHLLPD